MQIFFIILSAALFGLLCSGMAQRKNRNPIIWFFVGFSFGIFAVTLLLFLKPVRLETVQIVKKPLISHKDDNFWYYIDLQKKQIGPMSLQALLNNYFKGLISESTYVWNDTMTNWQKLKTMSFFSNVIKDFTS